MEPSSPISLKLDPCRDKSIIVWTLTKEEGNYGYAKRRLTGHSHFVEDVVISSDGQFALSGSWDGTLRLWDLNTGATTRRFLGHTKDVLSVAFSVDNRQVRKPRSMAEGFFGLRSLLFPPPEVDL